MDCEANWVALGAQSHENPDTHSTLLKIRKVMTQTSHNLPAYQFLLVIQQLVSRIMHPSAFAQQMLERIIMKTLAVYPQQVLWHLMAIAKSTVKERSAKVLTMLSKMKVFIDNLGWSSWRAIDNNRAITAPY
jgi:serine/threonine-protein kinase ATR